jgi:hypothetical protein
MKISRLIIGFVTLIALVVASAYLLAIAGKAQTIEKQIKPDVTRALKAEQRKGPHTRKIHINHLVSTSQLSSRPRTVIRAKGSWLVWPKRDSDASCIINGGTALTNVLHTSQLSMTSSAGTDEQFVDRTNDLIADDRTTFDSAGGSFDIAVGRSGTRYEVFSATLNNNKIGVLVMANDTNGDFVADSSQTFDLRRDFVSFCCGSRHGTSSNGREFVVVCSSGFFDDEPSNPDNEPSPVFFCLCAIQPLAVLTIPRRRRWFRLATIACSTQTRCANAQ